VSQCAYCQKVTTMFWNVECPDLLTVATYMAVKSYGAAPEIFQDRLAMEYHLKAYGDSCCCGRLLKLLYVRALAELLRGAPASEGREDRRWPETSLRFSTTRRGFIGVSSGGGIRTPAAQRFRSLRGPRWPKWLGRRGFPRPQGFALGVGETEAVGGSGGSRGEEAGGEGLSSGPRPSPGHSCLTATPSSRPAKMHSCENSLALQFPPLCVVNRVFGRDD
jgi:hypothetical protein